MKYKTAIYCRLSKEDERGRESSSIETQKKMLTGFAKEHGFEVYDTYIDVYNQRLIPFDTKKAVQTPKITAFESKNADRKPLFLFYEAMMSGCWIHQCTRQMGGGCICTQAK